VLGSQTAAQRGLLVYQRAMEATADESALRYLEATHQSARGMLDLFHKMADESLASTHGADPYAYSHPFPQERFNSIEATAKASAYYDKPDDPALVLRYELAKAKLFGFMQPQVAFQKYSSSNNSLPARYARAIAFFRRGDIANAIPIIDSLTNELPQDPYFWELKAQAYLENGRADQGLPAIKKARSILPNNGLLQILHAQVLLGSENPAHADEAITLLNLAKRTEPGEPGIFKFMAQAYGLKNQIPEATLATAEYAYAVGDRKLAVEKATLAKKYLKQGSPGWIRAGDILSFASK
jgi:predicted Zn-dependent protease